MKKALVLFLLFSHVAAAETPPKIADQIDRDYSACTKGDSGNFKVIECGNKAIADLKASSEAAVKRLKLKNRGKDAHNRDLSAIYDKIDKASSTFEIYVQNECIVEVYSGGAGTGSDNGAALAQCELGYRIARLRIMEGLAGS